MIGIFSYWTQRILGIKALFYKGIHFVFKNYPNAVEKITEEIQKEFANRVLIPPLAQKRLEQITENTVKVFISNLSNELAEIPEKYNIPVEDWENYLKNIAITIKNVEGNRRTKLSLKVLTLGTIAGSVKIVKIIMPYLKKIGAKIGEKVGSKVAAKAGAKIFSKIATKTGAKIASKFSGEMLGPIVGVAVLFWDLVDHYRTEKINRPILRKNLYEYVDAMMEDFLNDIMGVIDGITEQIITSLNA